MTILPLLLLLLSTLATPTPTAPPPTTTAPAPVQTGSLSVTVKLDQNLPNPPTTGRLVVALLSDQAKVPPGTTPHDAPFWEVRQPIFGLDVTSLKDGVVVEAGRVGLDGAEGDLGALPAGGYFVGARLIVHRRSSQWQHDAGNITSDVGYLEIKASEASSLTLSLSNVVEERGFPAAKKPGAPELFEVRSKLLSDFHGREVVLRAAVIGPTDFQADRQYAAVYCVPGFGGDHFEALRHRMMAGGGEAAKELAKNVYWIYLDPESPNGHTLFADSENNGPWGRALTEELIPALEKKYALKPAAEARLLRGHSSGGWSTLWLALTYPQTFGASWPTSPDPVDFRAFQLCHIYADANMFVDAAGKERPSYRRRGKELMTVRQENNGERVMGPNQTSGEQWASWQAVAGSREKAGNPRALFDQYTGAIDRAEAERWKKFDIGERVRNEPEKMIGLLDSRVRLICGDEDNFYLEKAVMLLRDDVQRLAKERGIALKGPGYIKLVEKADHGSVFASEAVKGIPGEMLEYLRGVGLVR